MVHGHALHEGGDSSGKVSDLLSPGFHGNLYYTGMYALCTWRGHGHTLASGHQPDCTHIQYTVYSTTSSSGWWLPQTDFHAAPATN